MFPREKSVHEKRTRVVFMWTSSVTLPLAFKLLPLCIYICVCVS